MKRQEPLELLVLPSGERLVIVFCCLPRPLALASKKVGGLLVPCCFVSFSLVPRLLLLWLASYPQFCNANIGRLLFSRFIAEFYVLAEGIHWIASP